MKKIFSKITGALTIMFGYVLILTAAVTAEAATLTVDTTTDDVNLAACTASANDCSLRGAIATAASGDTINFDATVFASAQTITLNGTSLAIGKSLTITGTGANLLTINGNALSRIFNISGASTVVLENMTITNGKTATSGSTSTRHGGGIYNLGGNNLTLNNMVVSGNQANLNGGGIFTTSTVSVVNVNNSTISGNTATSGGGIEQLNGVVNVSNSFILNNTAANGGGIDSPVSAALSLTVTNSVISGNSASSGYGGGIYKNYTSSNPSGNYNLIIKNSTVSNNTAAAAGGGVCILVNNSGDNSSETLLQNSTFSGNTANQGGGFYTQGIAANGINSTVANNTCNSGGSCGGGIYGVEGTGIINLLNTIVASNNGSTNPDIAIAPNNGAGVGKFVSYGNNLIGINDANSIYTTANGDQIGTSANPVNARLAPLGNNGGTTQTHALLSNSPAINAGNNCVTTSTCTGLNPTENLTTDQRGVARNGNVDIGSYEYLSPTAANVTVGGRVTTVAGRGIANVRVTIIDAYGKSRTALTSGFGYYHFSEVETGKTYVFIISAKRYTFTRQTQVLNINEYVEDINFTGYLSSWLSYKLNP